MTPDERQYGGGTVNLASRGAWGSSLGSNLTWQELAREQELKDLGARDTNQPFYNPWELSSGHAVTAARANRLNENAGTLQNFYTAQDQKYAGTADTQKRNYNALLDFLSNSGDRKKQGFAVRG